MSLQEQDVQAQAAQMRKRHMDNALHHAFLLQHRKDVEADILSAIEKLAELPEAAASSKSERETFINSMSFFQPSDYDDLVLERVSQSRCGYTLCAEKPRSMSVHSWQLGKTAQHFCSKQCQAKALYVQNQLLSIPAWERSPTDRVQIILPEDDRVIIKKGTTRKEAKAELAFERGEPASSRKPEQVMASIVVEKNLTVAMPAAPHLSGEEDSIEGYVPRRADADATTTFSDMATMQIAPQIALMPDSNVKAVNPDEEKAWRDMFEHLRTKG